jgi:hypothetical protein
MATFLLVFYFSEGRLFVTYLQALLTLVHHLIQKNLMTMKIKRNLRMARVLVSLQKKTDLKRKKTGMARCPSMVIAMDGKISMEIFGFQQDQKEMVALIGMCRSREQVHMLTYILAKFCVVRA